MECDSIHSNMEKTIISRILMIGYRGGLPPPPPNNGTILHHSGNDVQGLDRLEDHQLETNTPNMSKTTTGAVYDKANWNEIPSQISLKPTKSCR